MSNVDLTEKKKRLNISEERKKMAMPDVYVILVSFLLMAFLASLILPSGT